MKQIKIVDMLYNLTVVKLYYSIYNSIDYDVRIDIINLIENPINDQINEIYYETL